MGQEAAAAAAAAMVVGSSYALACCRRNDRVELWRGRHTVVEIHLEFKTKVPQLNESGTSTVTLSREYTQLQACD